MKLFENIVRQSFPEHIASGVMQLMQAATDPHAESAESAIRELPPQRRQAVQSHIERLDRHVSSIGQRGTLALTTMNPAEWNALFIEDAPAVESEPPPVTDDPPVEDTPPNEPPV